MNSSLPVLRGFIVTNVLRCYASLGGDPAAVCRQAGLPDPDDIAPSDLIPAERHYIMLNRMTETLGDPYLCARIGQIQARTGVTVLVEAYKDSRTLNDFLAHIRVIYRRSMSHTWHELTDDGRRAVWRVRRGFTPTEPILNMEGIHVGAFATFLLDIVGWDRAGEITASVPDPSRVPHDILPQRQMLISGGEPMKMSFPSDWLQARLTHSWEMKFEAVPGGSGPRELEIDTDRLRDIVEANIASRGVEIASVAEGLGVSVRQLQRYLNAKGTTFREIAREARLTYARKALSADPTRQIKDVALEAGFSTSQSLSRAFKAHFGESPTEFRARGASGISHDFSSPKPKL